MVAALFKASAALPRLYSQGIPLRAVSADKTVPQAVKSVRLEIGGKELIAVLFIVQIMLDDPVLVTAAGCVQAHLEIAVIHIDLVEAEFQIGEYGQLPHPVCIVAQLHIPDLHRIIHRHKQGLLRIDPAVITVILTVAQTVTAGIMLLRLSHRLPGYGPVIAAFLIPQIHIMPRSIHRHTVWPEPGDPVIFRGLIQQISSRCVVKHTIHILQTDIICPGNRHIHPVDHIFPIGIVKISIPHGKILPVRSFYNTISIPKSGFLEQDDACRILSFLVQIRQGKLRNPIGFRSFYTITD